MRDKIYDQLKNMSEHQLMHVWTERCNTLDYFDEHIYEMDCFDEFMHGQKPIEIARIALISDFNPNDLYFRFNSMGDVISFDKISDAIDFDELCDDIIDFKEIFDDLIDEYLLEVPDHD